MTIKTSKAKRPQNLKNNLITLKPHNLKNNLKNNLITLKPQKNVQPQNRNHP